MRFQEQWRVFFVAFFVQIFCLTSQGSEYLLLNEAVKSIGYSEKCSLSYGWHSQKAVMRCIDADGKQKQIVMTHLTKDYLLDGISKRWLYDLKVQSKGYLIHSDDWDKLLSLLAIPKSVKKADTLVESRIDTVIIDAGHGGGDHGTEGRYAGQLILEKDLTLIFARAMSEAIKAQLPELQIRLTRDDDHYVSLDRRVKSQIEKQKAKSAIFISFHMNHSDVKTVKGTELYVLGGTATDSQAQLTETLENKPWLSVIENKQDSMVLSVSDRLGLAKRSRSMAVQLAQELTSIKQVKMRGIKEGNFVVLSRVLVPSLLVEVGYLSNASELNALMNLDFQQRFAKAVANMVRRFINQEIREKL